MLASSKQKCPGNRFASTHFVAEVSHPSRRRKLQHCIAREPTASKYACS